MSFESPRTPEATPDDVAALLTARTKDEQGRELGQWTDKTRPTAEQVQVRIEIARSLVRDGFGAIPDQCLEGAETTVALLAAMLTEAAFWPEQTTSNQSTYERLRELYVASREGLAECIAVKGDAGAFSAYDLDLTGGARIKWPADWWQRDLENRLALRDALDTGEL